MGPGALRRHKFLTAACGCLVLAAGFALFGGGDGPADAPSPAAMSSGGVSILPADPAGFHELRASAGSVASLGSTRPAGTGITFQWSVNGQVVHTGPTLEPHRFGPEDTVTLRAEVTDASGPRTLGEATVQIRNSAPEIHVVNLQRDRQDPQTLVALADARDADGETLELHYQWEIDGKTARAKGDRFPVQDLQPGQRVTVTVVADDGRSTSEARRSGAFTLDNRPPRITVADSGTVRTLEDGTRLVSFTISTDDPDQDDLRVEFPGAPAGLSWDPATGTVSWPLAADAREGSVMARVTDAAGASVERDLSFRY